MLAIPKQLNREGQRHFSQINKTVCLMANSRQADLVGSKIMATLK